MCYCLWRINLGTYLTHPHFTQRLFPKQGCGFSVTGNMFSLFSKITDDGGVLAVRSSGRKRGAGSKGRKKIQMKLS